MLLELNITRFLFVAIIRVYPQFYQTTKKKLNQTNSYQQKYNFFFCLKHNKKHYKIGFKFCSFFSFSLIGMAS